MNNKPVVIALNGNVINSKEEYHQLYDNNYFFIAADGGAIFLKKLNFFPDVIIGDMDSISNNMLDFYKKQDTKIYEYPVEKDETDGELALHYCIQNNINRKIYIIGSQGGRFDQQLANIFLLEYAFKNDLNAVIKEPGLEVGIIKKQKSFLNRSNLRISLIPLSQVVKNVKIQGCKYNTTGIDLYRYKTRGISNKVIAEKVKVSADSGTLLYIFS